MTRTKKIVRFVAFVAGGLLLLLGIVAGLTQTQFFRDRLRALAQDRLDSLFAVPVYLGPLRGNLISGFSIDSMAIVVDGEPFLAAERINIQYNLLQIPGKTISIRKLSLVKPTLQLLRSQNGSWNFDTMLRPQVADTTPAAPFSWAVDVRNVEMKEGVVRLVDSLALAREEKARVDPSNVRYCDITLRHVNLALSAALNGKRKEVVVSSLSWVLEEPAFRLKLLSGSFTVTPESTVVEDMVVQTDSTDLALSVSLKNLDLLSGLSLEALRDKPVEINLRAYRFDLDEFKRFLPPVWFLHGVVSATLAASGPFGNLNIDSLVVAFGQSRLGMRGKITHLHEPSNLYIDVRSTESVLQPSDPLALLPPFHLPDFSSLGRTSVQLTYRGRPLEFVTHCALVTEAGGAVSVDSFAMAIGGPATLRYAGGVSFRDVDLAAISGDSALRSRFSGRAQIRGEGISLRTIRGSVHALLDSSEFRGLPVTGSDISADASGKKITLSAQLGLGKMRSSLTARLDGSQDESPEFSLNGDIASLNLADLLRDGRYDSDLTMSLNVLGQNLSLSRLNLEGFLDITSSRYGAYALDSSAVHLVLDQSGMRQKSFTVESDVADFEMTGAFDLAYLLPLIRYQILSTQSALASRFAAFDTTLVPAADDRELADLRQQLESAKGSVDASYRLNVKNLEPLSVVAGARSFDGIGTLEGRVRGDVSDLTFQAHLKALEFFYGSVESGVLSEEVVGLLRMDHLRPGDPLKEADLTLNVEADKVHINRNELDSLVISLASKGERATFAAGAVFDRNSRILLEGGGTFVEDTVGLRFRTFRVGYRALNWTAERDAEVVISPGRVSARNLVFRRNGEAIAFDGSIRTEGKLDLRVSAQGIDLDALKYFLSQEELGVNRDAFTGRGNFTIDLQGTPAQPEFTVKLEGTDVAFRGRPLGDLKGFFAYRDSSLDVNVGITGVGENGVSQLAVAGAVPINLGLAGVQQIVSDRPVNLRVQSSGFPISVLDPLISTFNDVYGTLQCDVTVGGSLRKPAYSGEFSLSDCVFLFVPNNIYYTFQGNFRAEGERIRVVDAVVGNLPGDARSGNVGRLGITGDFTLKNLMPGDFHLDMQGDLLLVKETTRKASLLVYGNLFVEIGKAGLQFTGSIDQSLLKGDLLVRNSSLVFPPAQGQVLEERATSVPVMLVNDTVKIPDSHHLSAAARYFGRLGPGARRQAEEGRDTVAAKTFLDGLRYDLDIEASGGSTEIRMVFNSLSGEELVATINGKFSITDDGRRWYGDLVVERAYYNFLKRISAEGRIRFNGDFLKPQLDITARYQGTRSVRDSSGERTENVIVEFTITGPRTQPNIKYGMTIDETDYALYRGPKSNDVQSDAIQYIVYGNFPLTASEKSNIPSDVQKTMGASILTGASSLLTGALSEYLRDQTGFIKSVELRYAARGSLTESADIRLSGVAWNGYWKYGGTILEDPLTNANFSILYSFDAIFRDPSLRNLMIEFERRVDPVSSGQTTSIKRVDSARLFYRFTF